MIDIIYEDDFIIAVNKPAGILVIPSPKKEIRTLTSMVCLDLEKRGLTIKAHPCHRLDRDTSGIILFAKGKKVQQEVMALFHQHQVKKKYLALVNGEVKPNEADINFKIENKPAITCYKVLKASPLYSSVEVVPLTGRTNQIRIHFKDIGHPLLGETKFAFRRDSQIKFKRTALHSAELEFIHPITKQTLKLSAPLPADMKTYF